MPISSEEIPDAHDVYYRIHISFVQLTGRPGPNCFRDNDGMSVDWSKYSTPDQTRRRQGDDKAHKYGIVGLRVGGVRQIEALSVQHVPRDGNDAHSNIYGLSKGEQLTRQRGELYAICGKGWLIAPG